MMDIGIFIRQQRMLRTWSLSELGKRAGGLSKGFLSAVENGKSDPGLASLQAIAKAFDMGAGDMLISAGYTVKSWKIVQSTITTTTEVITDVSGLNLGPIT